jgi:hypothetical protein
LNREVLKMKKTKVLNNESGFIKFIIVMLVLASIIYVGIKLGIPYYKYSALKSDSKEIARISVVQPIDRTRTLVYERAQELNIPLEEGDIEVHKTKTSVRIITGWSDTVDFLGIYQYTFDFTITVEE